MAENLFDPRKNTTGPPPPVGPLKRPPGAQGSPEQQFQAGKKSLEAHVESWHRRADEIIRGSRHGK